MKQTLLFCFRKIHHYLLSRSKFDIHSPFVYKIYSQILKDKTDYPEYCRQIENSTKRNMAISDKDHRLLFRLAKYFKPKTILIAGTMDETSASFLSSGFSGTCIKYIHDGTGLTTESGVFDMVFVSGDQPGNHIRDYFSQIMQHIHNDSVLILCNIHVSEEIHELWKEIRNHSSVTVTIDLFTLGLVFCKGELTKEDFILRY